MRPTLSATAGACLSALDRLERLLDGIRPPGRAPAIAEPAAHEIEHVLVWTMDRLGDVQRATPAIRILKKRYPAAHLAVVVTARSAPILECNPWVDAVYPVANPYDPSAHFQTLRRLPTGTWDLGVLLEVDPHWAKLGQWAFALLGVRRWGAFDFGWRRPPGAHMIPLDERGSWIDQFVRLAVSLGAQRDDAGLDLCLRDPERRWAEEFLSSRGVPAQAPFFLLHPGGNFLTVSRRWPPESYARLAELIRRAWAHPIVVTGAAAERGIVEAIRRRTPVPLVDLAGQLTLRQLMAVIERSALCIMNDTGPLHFAQALRRPTVAILGPTAPEVVGIPATTRAVRLDLPCSPCAFLTGWQACRNPRQWECVTALSPDQVFEAVVRQMARATGSALAPGVAGSG